MYNSTALKTTGIMTPQSICKENTDWRDRTLQAYIKQMRVSLSAPAQQSQRISLLLAPTFSNLMKDYFTEGSRGACT